MIEIIVPLPLRKETACKQDSGVIIGPRLNMLSRIFELSDRLRVN